MRILFAPILQRRLEACVLLLLLLLASCSREEIALTHLQTTVETEVFPCDGYRQQLLTLTASLTGEPGRKQVQVVAGNEKSSWLVQVQGDEKGLYTIGPLSMGRDVLLPQGRWKLSILSEDGQTLQESFDVTYQDGFNRVAYDAQDASFTLAGYPAKLSLYDSAGTLLSRQSLEPYAEFSLEQSAAKAEVFFEDADTTYIIIP